MVFSSYLFLWAEIHERCIMQEIWHPGGIYIGIPVRWKRIERIIVKDTQNINFYFCHRREPESCDEWNMKLSKKRTYFSICLIKWLLSHNPARERNPHLMHSKFKRSTVYLWLKHFPQIYTSNKNNQFRMFPNPILPFVEELSICF